MQAIFEKENDKMIIVTDDSAVHDIIEGLINDLFLEVSRSGNKYTMAADMSNLELFHNALKDKNVKLSLTEKMVSALEKTNKFQKDTAVEEHIVKKIARDPKKSTRKNKKQNNSNESGIQSLTLTKLFNVVKKAIELNLPNEIWLEAEIANLTRSPKGHYYLDLIETDYNGNEIAKNKAIIWSSTAQSVNRKFKEGTGSDLSSGQKVLLKVSVKFEVRFGLNLSVVDINPSFTLGDMDAKIIKIVNQLKEEGIYELNKRVKLPYIYKKLAVISPEEAAGLKDFQVDAEKLSNSGICDFDYYQAFFQGREVKSSILKAFENIRKSGVDYDAIIIIRGGGAKTDLHYLNEYEIAKEICNNELPVIVGIGHQIDHGVLDEVACIQQDTPSKVIGYIYTTIQERYTLLAEARQRIIQNLSNFIQMSKNDIVTKNNSNKSKIQNCLTIYKTNIENKKNEISQKLTSLITVSKNDIESKRKALPNSIKNIIRSSKNVIEEKQSSIKMNLGNAINAVKRDVDKKYYYITQFDPKELFKKGFSVALNKSDKPIESVKDVKNGDSIKIYLKDGSINTKVEKSDE